MHLLDTGIHACIRPSVNPWQASSRRSYLQRSVCHALKQATLDSVFDQSIDLDPGKAIVILAHHTFCHMAIPPSRFKNGHSTIIEPKRLVILGLFPGSALPQI